MIKNGQVKSALFIVLACLAGLAVLFLIKVNKKDSGGNNEQATLILYAGQTRREFTGVVIDHMSVLDALYSSSLGGNFDVRYMIGEDGKVKIYSLNVGANDSGKNWVIYLNKQKIKTEDTNSIFIKRGDLIEVKLE